MSQFDPGPPPDELPLPSAQLELLRLEGSARIESTGQTLKVGDVVRVRMAGLGFGTSTGHREARGLDEWLVLSSGFGRQLGWLRFEEGGWRLLHLRGGGELWIDDVNVGKGVRRHPLGEIVTTGNVVSLGGAKQIALRFVASWPDGMAIPDDEVRARQAWLAKRGS